MEDIMSQESVHINPTKSVIIEPRQSIKERMLANQMTTIKCVTSTPTSVIVNPKPPPPAGPIAVTQSMFRRIELKSKESSILSSSKSNEMAPKAVTASFFTKPMVKNGLSDEKEKTTTYDDEDILASLISFESVVNQEKLAPHCGDSYEPIKHIFEKPETIDFEKLPSFDIGAGNDDPFDFLPLDKSVFDELIKKEEN